MKKLSAKLTEFAMLVVLVAGCIGTVGQLTAQAQDQPILPGGGGGACAGLACYDGSDCGPNCFCNRPSSACYAN